jgi:arginine decarboxylase
MRAYWDRETLSFAIPAHNGCRSFLPEAAGWAGTEAFRFDLPMSHGVDTRTRSRSVQITAQELFAEAVGAKQTFFSTNGSSMSAHVAIMAVSGPGEVLVMARNGHKSAFAGLVMSGARPVYVDPAYDEELDLAHGVAPGELEKVLDRHPEARAVMVFTPTYYGISADVEALARVCHDHDVPLVTDDAWGLDYDFHPDLPPPALPQGSDLAIGSVHKSLTGLSQTSVLSVGSDRIDLDRLQLCFELEESTSASCLLLSSIDGARRQFVRDGRELLDSALAHAAELRGAIDGLEGLDLLGDEVLGRPGAEYLDPTHVTFDVTGLGLTGYQAEEWLRDRHQIEFELIDHRRLMALVTFAHDDQAIERLVRALRDLVAEHRDASHDARGEDLPGPTRLRTETVALPREAFFGPTETVPAASAAGRTSAEIVTPYPPGIPALAPGERITEHLLDYLQRFIAAGGFVEGATDQSLAEFRVVA